jgi:hypothetical protein
MAAANPCRLHGSGTATFQHRSCSSLIVSTKLLAETYTNPDKAQVIIHLFIDSKMIAKSTQA